MPKMTRTRDAFAGMCTSLTSVNLPLISFVGSTGFSGCSSLPIYVGQSTAIVYASAFVNCTSLETIDILGGNTANGIKATAFKNTKLSTLILRSDSAVTTLYSTNVFDSSPFASNGTGGTLYVPNSMISSYESATNWSTILGYTNNQIKSIESTHTDPNADIDLTLYYADGTAIPSS